MVPPVLAGVFHAVTGQFLTPENLYNIAQQTAQLAMSGQAAPTSPQFAEIMTKQWALIQQMAKLNTDLMLGVMTPKK